MNNISSCKKCKRDIIWVKTKNGKNMPFDLRTTVVMLETKSEIEEEIIQTIYTGHVNIL